jgi:hypothetical protein
MAELRPGSATKSSNVDLIGFLRACLMLIGACLAFNLILVPAVSGQSCPDILSGHVPRSAERVFLGRLVSAVVAQDFESLSRISTSGALAELRELGPFATMDYEITMRDDLLSSYERRLLFNNGTLVHITFHGNWPCPDFFVTDQEIEERLKLTGIRLVGDE